MHDFHANLTRGANRNYISLDARHAQVATCDRVTSTASSALRPAGDKR